MSTPDFTLPPVQAHYIELAADYIERHGKFDRGYWPLNRDEHGIWLGQDDFEPGMPCCTVGAIAVQLGIENQADVDKNVLGMDPFKGLQEPHPVLVALQQGMHGATVEDIFAWSDSARDDQVVARLRQVAAQLRASVDIRIDTVRDHPGCRVIHIGIYDQTSLNVHCGDEWLRDVIDEHLGGAA
jgi:hypothetical protein